MSKRVRTETAFLDSRKRTPAEDLAAIAIPCLQGKWSMKEVI